MERAQVCEPTCKRDRIPLEVESDSMEVINAINGNAKGGHFNVLNLRTRMFFFFFVELGAFLLVGNGCCILGP